MIWPPVSPCIPAEQHTTHELDTVHALSADVIGEETEEELAEKGTDRVCNLDAEVLVGRVRASLMVDVANHRGGYRYREDVIRISEKPDS